MDIELKMDAALFKSEVEMLWIRIEPVLQRHAHIFPGYTKESFLRVHNYVVTHCWGYPDDMPSTMIVPLADMFNCLPTDTSYNIYSKQKNISFVPKKKIDFSAVYAKEFKEGLMDSQSLKLNEAKGKRARVSRETRIEEIRCKMEQDMKHFAHGTENQVAIADIWQEKGY